MAERLASDLEATQEKSDDMFKAIEQIANPSPNPNSKPSPSPNLNPNPNPNPNPNQAIEQIARVAATFTATPTATLNE